MATSARPYGTELVLRPGPALAKWGTLAERATFEERHEHDDPLHQALDGEKTEAAANLWTTITV